ncbi:S-layer homology domain-containing protein [Bilifractor sp. HCP3S3_D3]|uniref:S-layer homology domain-containing protein n=1 Tax=Bilifractor sp. HCP3S3_D3 TaxID=3438907 RepID=UPI003F8A640C
MARNKFLKRMAVTALAASMTFGAVPAMATPALAASTVSVASAVDHLTDDKFDAINHVKTALDGMTGVTSATTADAIKTAVATAFPGYNVQASITSATPSGYYDDGQHNPDQNNGDYHNYGKITGTVTLSSPKNNATPDSQKTTTYNFVLDENAYTADEKIALAEHFIQKYFDEVKPFAATDETVEGKPGDEIKDVTMVSMAQAALDHYEIAEYRNGSIKVVGAANTSAPVNDDKNNTMTFTSDITVSADGKSHTNKYTATRDRAHHYLTRQFATAVQKYLEDDDTIFANDVDAEKLASVINNLRFWLIDSNDKNNEKGVGSPDSQRGDVPADDIYVKNFNGLKFAECLKAAGLVVNSTQGPTTEARPDGLQSIDYAQLKHISISAGDIKIGEANKKLAKHGVTGHVSVNFQLKEDGYNDDQVFTADLKLKQTADEKLTEMTDEMTRLFNAGETNTLVDTIKNSVTDYASAPFYDTKNTTDKADDELGGVTADRFAKKLFDKAGQKQVDDAYNQSPLSDDHVEYNWDGAHKATYSDYVEPTTKADGSIKVNATVRVDNPWYATYDGTMTPDEQYVTKDVSFTVTIPKLNTVAATDIELANARTLHIVRGYDGKLSETAGANLKIAESIRPMLYTKPATANDIVWTSSDPSVATVDENGIVTAVKGGKAVITATSATNPKINDSVTINVKEDYNGFVDVVDPSAYYFTPVYWAKDHKVTAGTTSTTFSPSSTVSRGDMITWLYRYAGSPAVSTTTKFKDVKDSDYYAKAVAWATSKGITFGTSDTTFSPKKAVTRAEMISFLYRYSQAVGKTDGESGKSDFNDVLSSKYYASAVAWGAENGVVAGYADGTFRPDKTCTRAEGVSFIYRAVSHTKGNQDDNLLKKTNDFGVKGENNNG